MADVNSVNDTVAHSGTKSGSTLAYPFNVLGGSQSNHWPPCSQPLFTRHDLYKRSVTMGDWVHLACTSKI